ncbi:ribonuclease E activity regulator RraA [Candidatus Viridilinea mediisalina]|uniref:4-hydroxy-4-methyl-2-oxoglutarate aldolase n=1 Tax=Candidatus Viridilinea mediisalina TaxID=2024553 RepID=A0A2A6RJ96_9CHLR|nr:ribonuclease E activity regulator RraA [Candidatus Viridilinea mediisalina]PDW02920.1 ribonuclease [Candidatus Viridilinea mediisalina]
MDFKTTDLSDAHPEVQVGEPLLHHIGGLRVFGGPIETLKVFEDNALVRKTLEEQGEGRVLVVDGGGSLRCALLGDQLAELALANGWVGVVVHGCVRDSAALAQMPLGVLALAVHPRRSIKRGDGVRGGTLHFAGLTLTPGFFLYADADGVIVSEHAL